MANKKKTTAGEQPAAAGNEHKPGVAFAHPNHTMNGNGAQPTGDLAGVAAELEQMADDNAITGAEVQRQQLAERIAGNGDAKIFWSAGDLLAAEFPEPVWAVPNLIPAGTTILAGRPKLGKSWLALQAGVGVASGGQVLGEEVEQRKVLYLALEDGKRRLQDRLNMQRCPSDAAIDFVTEWPTLLEQGEIDLMALIDREGYQFVIVDTLARFSGARRADDEAKVALKLGALQRFAVDNNIALLLVDHHRKPGASAVQDVIDDIMGGTGKAGIADAALGLYRRRGQRGAELKLTGRDLVDRELAVEFDKQLFTWQMLGDADAVASNTIQGQILATMHEAFDGQASCSELAKYLTRDRSNVHRELQELMNKGHVIKLGDKVGREVIYQAMSLENE